MRDISSDSESDISREGGGAVQWSSGETGEVYAVYKFFIITKWSTHLPVNTYQYSITIRARRHIAKILDKSYEYRIFDTSLRGLV